ncbi:MAG: bifunctional diaminohydroxyphosphoribosylaminopyrimidine deaminase/5-amino-6-(5-phosphoribosylamino)uracil reductase RibD [Opitutales bacterium]
MLTDIEYMQEALLLAKKALGKTHPNPMVGAVIVEDGEIVARGFHAKDGTAHAERVALNSLKYPLKKGAKIYVTLEPCSTEGRTGSCTQAIINAGISEVIIGTLDPNPKHKGRAIKLLESAGISVKVGVLQEECESLNCIFNYVVREQKALLCMKFAMSRNLIISEGEGVRTKISSQNSLEHLMTLRELFPAIAVGAKTLICDNPKLSIRNEEGETCNHRLLFDRSLSCLDNLDKNLFSDNFSSKTIVIADLDSPKDGLLKLDEARINYIILNSKRDDEAGYWNCLKQELFARGIYAVLIEGGFAILQSLLKTKAFDYYYIYKSPNALKESCFAFKREDLSFLREAKKLKLGIDGLHFGARNF